MKTVSTVVVALCLLLPVATAARAESMESLSGLDKIQGELLSAIEKAQGEAGEETRGTTHRVLISLASTESETERTAAYRTTAGLRSLQSRVAAAQDTVLTRRSKGHFELLNRYRSVYGFSAVMDRAAILELANLPEVEAIEIMPVFRVMDAESHPLANVDSVHSSGFTGDGVTIAIIDDGIDHDHAAFGGQSAWPNSKILGGYDFADNDSNPRIDCTDQSHGTAVTGVAAGDGGGVTGTAPDASVVFLKVQAASECGQPTLSGDVAGAIDWAVTNRATYGIDIISMSLGGGSYSSATSCDNASTAYRNAVNAAHAAGMVVLAASGNDGYCSQISHPSCMSNVISVGAVYDVALGSPGSCVNPGSCVSEFHPTCATFGLEACFDVNNSADQVTCYSNSASILDILAPSNCATTALAGGGTDTCFGGTSSATPFAAGVAATLLEADGTLDNDGMRSLLADNGVSINDSKSGISRPRVDAAASHAAIGGGGGPGAPCTGCEQYSGSLSGAGDSDAHPNGTYYFSGAGTHQGWLEGPSGTDFDLELYRWNGRRWSRVARSISSTSSEQITYNGASGYYYWRILSYTGSGSYDFWLDRP